MALMAIGTHAVRVVSHGLGKSGTGTPYIAVLFENEAAERLSWYGYLSEKAIERTVKTLEDLGWVPAHDGGDITALNGTDRLVGAEAEIVVEAEVYDGKERRKVKWVNRPGGGVPKMEEGDAAGLAASLRGRIMSAASPAPSAKPGPARAAAPAAGPADDDDDLPF